MNSPYSLSAKPGILAVCIAPHRYLSGPAVSPPDCIHRTLRPKGSSLPWRSYGDFLSFHLRASWRTVYQSPAAAGVAVLPSKSLVVSGKHGKLYTADATGKPVTVNWTLPEKSGSIRPGLKQGEYIYTAPAGLTGVTEVTAKAVNVDNSAQTGMAVIQVMPSSTIDVQPAQQSVKLGSKLTLTATVTAGDAEKLRWVVYPSGLGTVTFDLDNPAKATYTAPASAANGNQATILAYLIDDKTAGMGSAAITQC